MNRDELKFEAIDNICDKLSERNAVLFLGAGINYGIKNEDGLEAPLGQKLSQYICKILLEDDTLEISLDDATEIARHRLGEKLVNKYLYDLFISFKPGSAHLVLVQLPWDVIYTTNYDLLVEIASENNSITSAGNICPICSKETDLSIYSEEDILYYKLHGSIDFANTKDMKLILTKEDYRDYEYYRKPLFKRLERDLLNRTIVYIGYSQSDTNFRKILDDCKEVLGTETLPRSYAIRPKFSKVEEAFWIDKYNIQLIESDGYGFLCKLKENWEKQSRNVIPFEERKNKIYMNVDGATRFQKVGESFYLVRNSDIHCKSNPKLFFCGAEPTWGDIKAEIAPQRDQYLNLFESLFVDLAEPLSEPSAYLVTGSAGTGKTTLIFSLCHDVEKSFSIPVLMHISNTPLDVSVLGPLVDTKAPKRIVIIVRNAAEKILELIQFIDELRRKKLPVTLILEERKNQWRSAVSSLKKPLRLPEFELSELSEQEIKKILGALKKHDALGKLKGISEDFQISHFRSLANKDLLVALRELTTQNSFDKIIRDEFTHIPSDIAKKAYIYVSALGQVNLSIRYETLIHLLDLNYDHLRNEIFTPTEGILISGEETGHARHNFGFRLRTRHPIIASIIFSSQASDDDSKFEILNNLFTNLDVGYSDDKKLLEQIIGCQELVNVFESPEKQRAIYERLENILPDNPYVYQHRSLLEKKLGNPEKAVIYARKALAYKATSQTLKNTLGLALEFQARTVDDNLKWKALIQEATKIFDENIRHQSHSPYGYLGKVYILRQKINLETNIEEKALLQAEAFSLLEEAREMTSDDAMIISELAVQKKYVDETQDAILLLTNALDRKPEDERLRNMLIKFKLIEYKVDDALKIGLEGIKFHPNSWRLHKQMARIKSILGDSISAVIYHYESAIRHQKKDISLLVELGAYLFTNLKEKEAVAVFAKSRDFSIPSFEKHRIRQWFTDNNEKRIFTGKVKTIKNPTAYAIAIPENFEAFFYTNKPELANLKVNDKISFYVGFNAYGPVAIVKTC